MRSLFLARRARVAAAATACAAVGFCAGCGNKDSAADNGVDLKFLVGKPPKNAVTQTATGASVLPLAVGTRWYLSFSGGKPPAGGRNVPFEARVVGPGPTGGGRIVVTQNGIPWRTEVLENTPRGLLMRANAEENKPLMELVPPVTLARFPLQEGGETPWRGTFRFKGKTYPATAFSRVSTVENVTTPAGRFLAYRVDTLITVTGDRGQIIRFPSIRWLAPGIGFVRHGFVDRGQPIYTDLRAYQPAGS